MIEHELRRNNEALLPGETFEGNYPIHDANLSIQTRYSIGYGPTATEMQQELLASGKYENVRRTTAYDVNGKVLFDMEAILVVPKKAESAQTE